MEITDPGLKELLRLKDKLYDFTIGKRDKDGI